VRIKVILSVSFSSSPELYTELLNIPARSRAERIRSLATVGIASSKRIPDVRLPEFTKPRLEGNRGLMDLSSQGESCQERQETREEQKERMEIASRVIRKLSKSL